MMTRDVELIPKWESDVLIDQRLSEQRSLMIRKVKALRTKRFSKDRIVVVRLDEVLEALEGDNYEF